MSSISDNDIISHIYRRQYHLDVTLQFKDILKDALRSTVTADDVEIDRLTDVKKRGLWRLLHKEISQDINRQIVPLFNIVDEMDQKIRWIGTSSIGVDCRKRYKYVIRPALYQLIDEFSYRQYESLACVLCQMLGAQNVMLTLPGNDGGIDFLASIKFSASAHYLFGTKGPLRIVGQCKKYSSSDNVGHMMEFIQTLQYVYNHSYRPGEVLPNWFKANPGPIIGWHIAHSGHQSGASDLAKNFGILISDTKELIDLICKLKIPCIGARNDKIIYLNTNIQYFLLRR